MTPPAVGLCVYYRSMPVLQEIREGGVPVKVYTGEMEAAARQQLVNVSRLPIVHHHVAAMPDVHLGIGATVGAVIPTLRAIIPAAVGVDIGCGMIATRLSLSGNQIEEKSLRRIFDQISRDVPVGFDQHEILATRLVMRASTGPAPDALRRTTKGGVSDPAPV
jgi:tRNA-splicing ligase RtcB